ncbi:hypothetical protein [Paenibacillus hamazuiensis]|uniref:hypothetical protein n=1 Tax=Paenibacillus hamazuiensis TaxID=2936508 RepID=UPI00200D71B5|nr:hypothetical protein [Paenibacillus hamazuiensis]
MGFVLFFALTWATVFVLYSMRKGLTAVESIFIFLLVMILSINFSWIVIEELYYVQTSGDPLKYAAFMLERSVLIPIVFTIMFNYIYDKKSTEHTLLAVALGMGEVLGSFAIARYFQILYYVRWNLIYDAVVFLAMLFITFYAHKLLRKSMNVEVKPL